MKSLLSSVVLRNFGALSVLQVGTYLAPLLLVPYLTRVLGIELFGSWMFAMAFVIFARICVSYGFDLTATKQVAVASDSMCRLSELLADVVAVRLLIWLLCFVLIMCVSLLSNQIAEVRPLIVIAFFILPGEAIFPVWLFQGMETMGAITLIRLGTKLANLSLVLAFVKGPDDILLVPLIEATTMMAGGLIALVLAIRRFGLRLVWPSPRRVETQLRDGGPIFVATLAVQFYTTLNMIVLGFIVGPAAVGAYAIAEKIYSALRGLLGPFVQAVFPAMARLHDAALAQFSEAYRGVLRLLVLLLLAVSVTLFATAPLLVLLIVGASEPAAVDALRVFAIAFPFAVGSFLAPMLVVRGRNVALMRITILGGFIGLVLAPPLSTIFGAAGAAGAFLAVQMCNSIALIRANRADT